jgi:hypothetical protein
MKRSPRYPMATITLYIIYFLICKTCAQEPYAIMFDFATPSIPKDTCQSDIDYVMEQIYHTYIDNVISDSWWTNSTVSMLANGSERRQLVRANSDHRQLKLRCTASICRDSPYIILAKGCRAVCGSRRHRRTDERRDQLSLYSCYVATGSYSSCRTMIGSWSSYSYPITSNPNWYSSTLYTYPFNQSNTVQGWRGNYVPDRAVQVAHAFYLYAKHLSSSYCRSILSNMTYILVDYELES